MVHKDDNVKNNKDEQSEKAVELVDVKENETVEQKEALIEHFKLKADFTRTFQSKALDKDVKTIIAEQGYEIKQELGQGGFATVFKTVRTNDKLVLAAKVIELKEKKESRLRDCKTELFVLEKISHQNLVKLYDHFMIDNKFYIMLEFADGGTMC